MELLIVLWLAMPILCAYVASQRGRGWLEWGLLGLLFGIFALVALALIPSRKPQGM